MLPQSWRSEQRNARPTSSSFGIDRLHALIGVDHHREEREHEQDDHLGGGLVAGPQHDQRNQRDRRDRIEERDVDGEPDVEHAEARQQQADRDAEDDGEAKPDHQHDQARPQIAPQLAAPDHLDGRNRDLARRREQHRVDVGPGDLPERQARCASETTRMPRFCSAAGAGARPATRSARARSSVSSRAPRPRAADHRRRARSWSRDLPRRRRPRAAARCEAGARCAGATR